MELQLANLNNELKLVKSNLEFEKAKLPADGAADGDAQKTAMYYDLAQDFEQLQEVNKRLQETCVQRRARRGVHTFFHTKGSFEHRVVESKLGVRWEEALQGKKFFCCRQPCAYNTRRTKKGVTRESALRIR